MKLLSFLLGAAVALPLALTSVAAKPAPKPPLQGIHKIEHVVVIMQENRSFDEYFGTFPGADGIPAGVCFPDPANGGCVQPYHDPADVNHGGPHTAANAQNDIHGGAMDGFVDQAEFGRDKCRDRNNPNCGGGKGRSM